MTTVPGATSAEPNEAVETIPDAVIVDILKTTGEPKEFVGATPCPAMAAAPGVTTADPNEAVETIPVDAIALLATIPGLPNVAVDPMPVATTETEASMPAFPKIAVAAMPDT